MKASEVRQKYLSFFKSSPRNHVEIPPAPLVLENDPTTLFTSSGMQPLVPYLMGEPHPKGKRLVDSQPSVRAHGKNDDILEVGDNRHLTVFEMLGNWSLGDYFKEEQLSWFFEYLTKELNLSANNLWVSCFEGYKDIPKDKVSFEIWKKLGIPENRILYYGTKKNWWSRSGPPEEMPAGEIGGPTSEVFYDFGEGLKLHEKSKYKDKECHPNCDCGRFLEIGNSVFMQYIKTETGDLKELPQKNVDFGGGLERLTSATINSPDLFKTDLFWGIIQNIERHSQVNYEESNNKSAFRIIADHIKASAFLIDAGVIPSNKEQGYVLRRLLRRSIAKMHSLNGDLRPIEAFKDFVSEVVSIYDGSYFNGEKTIKLAHEIIEEEIHKFGVSLEKGMKYLNSQPVITSLIAFNSLATYGIPFEITQEVAKEKNQNINLEEFKKEFEKHRELSRTTSAGMFKGGLADQSENVKKLHTAVHLLQAALRKVLGNNVIQKGQNITGERARFDFSHTSKLTDEEIKKVEKIVNEKIDENLPVSFKEMSKKDAEKTGAIHAFDAKYGETVKVYFVGKDLKSAFSKEFCGGPHMVNTSEIGHVKITKQDKVGSGVVRLYIVLSK